MVIKRNGKRENFGNGILDGTFNKWKAEVLIIFYVEALMFENFDVQLSC